MAELGLPDLGRMLEASAGVVDGVDWTDRRTLDLSFQDIGYDSLALLELGTAMRREYGVPLPDDALVSMDTPASALDFVNKLLADR